MRSITSEHPALPGMRIPSLSCCVNPTHSLVCVCAVDLANRQRAPATRRVGIRSIRSMSTTSEDPASPGVRIPSLSCCGIPAHPAPRSLASKLALPVSAIIAITTITATIITTPTKNTRNTNHLQLRWLNNSSRYAWLWHAWRVCTGHRTGWARTGQTAPTVTCNRNCRVGLAHRTRTHTVCSNVYVRMPHATRPRASAETRSGPGNCARNREQENEQTAAEILKWRLQNWWQVAFIEAGRSGVCCCNRPSRPTNVSGFSNMLPRRVTSSSASRRNMSLIRAMVCTKPGG